MPRTAVLICVLTVSATPAAAQTASKPDGRWRGSLGAGATITSGNNNSITFTLNADAVKETHYDKISSYLQAVYGRREDNGATQRTADLIRGGGKYDRDLNDRAFGFGSLDFERNKLVNLELRSVIAGGLGYHVVRREGLTFDVSSGPAYNREQFSTQTRDQLEWLLAEESTHALSPTVSFRQRLAYYSNLKDSGEYRGVFDAGLVFKVTDRWSATLSLNDRYQSNPLPGVKKNDVLVVTGLQYSFQP